MEFDEMKKIWDSQNKKTMYAIDEESLQKVVMQKVRTAERKVNIFEFGIIAVTIFVGCYQIIDGLQEENALTEFITALAAFSIAIYIAILRIRRLKSENQFGQSLLGSLENAIANIDYLIRQGKTFVWWYMLPFGIVTLISMLVNSSPITSWALVFGAFILAYSVVMWEVRKIHIPKKKNLEALRRTLTQV